MAEAFARKYGSDVLIAESAGLAPSLSNVPQTRKALAEKNVDLGNHLPRALDRIELAKIDLIVNMSGQKLPSPAGPKIEDWYVKDPIGASDTVYGEVRDQIEMKVMNLVLRIRNGKI